MCKKKLYTVTMLYSNNKCTCIGDGLAQGAILCKCKQKQIVKNGVNNNILIMMLSIA